MFLFLKWRARIWLTLRSQIHFLLRIEAHGLKNLAVRVNLSNLNFNLCLRVVYLRKHSTKRGIFQYFRWINRKDQKELFKMALFLALRRKLIYLADILACAKRSDFIGWHRKHKFDTDGNATQWVMHYFYFFVNRNIHYNIISGWHISNYPAWRPVSSKAAGSLTTQVGMDPWPRAT